MQTFTDYITEAREIKHRATGEGKAVDEEVFQHFANKASKLLRNKISTETLLGLVEQAKNDPSSPLSYKNSPVSLFTKGVKSVESGAKQSYYDMLEMSAHSLGEMAKHKDFQEALKHGFTVKRVGRAVYNVTQDWTRHGVKQGSITGTPKSDLHIVDNLTGKTMTVSMKRGEGQGLSAQPSEAMSVLTYTANKVMSEKLDRTKNPIEYTEVFALLEKMNKLLRSTSNIENRDKRESAIQKVKKQVKDIYDNLYERPYLGLAWKKAIIHEAITGRGKFGKNSEAVANHVLTFGGKEKASFDSADEYLNLSDDEVGNTPLYWTLPKTEGGRVAVFRTGTPKRSHKAPEPEPVQEKPKRQEREHPMAQSNYAPGSDQAFYSPHELKPDKAQTRPTKIVKSGAKPVMKKPGLLSKVKSAFKGQAAPVQGKAGRQIDYERVKREYESNKDPLYKVAQGLKISHSTLSKHAKEGGWQRPQV